MKKLASGVMIPWLVVVLPSVVLAGGKYFEVSYEPSDEPGELAYGVTYTVWIPDGVETLKAVMVHQHGCGSGACQGGDTAAYDLHWQALARKWNMALLGPSYHQQDGQDCRKWCDPRNGSEKAYLKALADLSTQSGHAELERVPWCLWGHSGGAFWSSLMQTLHSDRIVAIWFRSGTAYAVWEKGEIARPEIRPAAYGIPMMCNPGAKENGDERFRSAWDGSLAMFQDYRGKGAPIGFAPDPLTGHECGDSRYLAIRFFDACLALRLPDASAADQTLRPIDLQQGWYADLLGKQTSPRADFQGDWSSSAWLPTESFAKAWEEYVTTGAVSDSSPPASPVDVRLSSAKDGNGTQITWSAEADFESGVQAFIVMRNGKQLAQVPETPAGRYGRPLFQTMSYHDTPEKPLPEMRFVDTSPGNGADAEYRVITVNGVGQRSPSSATAAPAKSEP